MIILDRLYSVVVIEVRVIPKTLKMVPTASVYVAPHIRD